MSFKPVHNRIASGVSAAALAVVLAAAPAYAQETAETAQAEDSGRLGEIVVTAQFRSQNVQDTPLAITAVSAEMMENRTQTSLATLADQAPNVNLRETGGAFGPGMSAFIRGVGQADFNPALEPGVGIYIDDVYYSSLTGANFDLVDLERVEILRGPQGTLAGRNSIGGAIKLFSIRPQGDNSGSIQGRYGSGNLIDIRATADMTIVPDTLMMRISGVARHQDGYVSRMDYGCLFPTSGVPRNSEQGDCKLGSEGGKDYAGGRVGLRWLAGSKVEVNLIADLTVDSSQVAAVTLLDVNPDSSGAALTGALTGWDVPYDERFIPSDPFVSYAGWSGVAGDNSYHYAPRTRTTNWGVSGHIDIELSDTLALKSITSYREFDSSWNQDNDVSPLSGSLGSEHVFNNSFSQEIRLSGSFADKAVEWTIGGFYFDQTTTYPTHQILTYAGGLDFLGDDPVEASTKAGFANATWHITDKLNFNGGIRYTTEKKDYKYARYEPDGVTPHWLLGSLTGVVGHYDGDKWDWRANVDYRWSDALMTYAQVSTGFKGGGVNPRPFFATQARGFDPETITAYEVGFKGDFFDRAFRLNGSAFFNKYKDIQLTRLSCPEYSPPGLGFLCALPTNGGNADVKGVEFETLIQPVNGLTIDGSISYIDFKYTWTDPSVGIPTGATAPGTIKWKWSAGIQYAADLGDAGTLIPRFDINGQTGYNTNAVATADNRVAGYKLANARLTWKAPDDEWEAALTVSNLFDKLWYTGVFDLLASSGAKYGTPQRGREWQLTVKKKF